jgi:Methyltransferase domain
VPAAEDLRGAAEAFLATAPWTQPEPPPDTLMTVRVRPSAVTVTTLGRAWRALAEAVGGLIENRRRLWALEAGAGEKPLFDLPEDAFIVGVNKDMQPLEANTRLDQRIPVDLAEFEPAAAGFDLITSWYGLEELADPADVLDKFARWAGPGGLIVLAVPNLLSPRSLLARARGRTRLRRCLTPTALRNRFDEHGFTPVFQVYFEDSDQTALRRRFKLTRGWWTAAQGLVRAASLGFVDAARTDYLVIFRRDD